MTDESNVSARVGDELPELCVEIDARRMFFFSAAAYNGHRIHYDQDHARAGRLAQRRRGFDRARVRGPGGENGPFFVER